MKTYYGKPCQHGHPEGLRYLSNKACVPCHKRRLSNRDRQAESRMKARYRANNREKILLSSARARAETTGLEFNLELEDIKIPSICPVFGTPLTSPSLDRKDNSKGYIKGNVFVISLEANRMKRNATIDQLEKILEYMKK